MPAKVKAKIPALASDSPQTASILSKLNTSQSQNRAPYTSYDYMSVAYATADRLRANTSILQLLPDLEIAIEIITACMLDPNGVIDNDIVYTAPAINMSSSLKGEIVSLIKKYINVNYKLTDKLPEIIREAMFTHGAYVEAIIPEASVDRLVNYSGQYQVGNDLYLTNEGIANYLKSASYDKKFKDKKAIWSMNVETYKNKYGSTFPVNEKTKKSSFDINLLSGKREVILTEEDLGIEITDNYNILRQPELKLQLQANKKEITKTNTLHNTIRANMEEYQINLEAKGKGRVLNKDVIDYLDVLFRKNDGMKPSDVEFGLKIDETIRDSLSSPLIMKLPVESVIPIYAKNEPGKHVGYFVLLDIEGYPINIIRDLEEIDAQSACLDNNSTDDLKTGLINKAKMGLYGSIGEVPTLQNIEVLYGDIVDHMIKSKLRNSEFEDLVEIRDTADIYKVMMARALAAKKTKILYLPLELVQYYAFKYRRNGTGESLLERAAMLASMAGMLLYSNVKSSISNSIPITDITLTLDEDDPEPLKTAEQYMSNVLKANRVGFPLGLVNPVYLEDWMVRSGFTVNVKSPRLPDIEISREVRGGTQGDVIDSSGETYDKIMHMIYKLFGISPELIAKSAEDGFASIFLAKDKLFAKRIKAKQAILSNLLTLHVRKIITNDPILRQMIADKIVANKAALKKHISTSKTTAQDDEDEIILAGIKDKDLADYIIDIFRTTIDVDLPVIELGEEDDKSKLFENVSSTVETVINTIYDKLFPDTISGKLSEKREEIKGMIHAGYMRQWMIENNYVPEIITWHQKTDDNLTENPYITDAITDAVSILKAYVDEYTHGIAQLKSANKAMEKLNEKLEENGFSTSGSDMSSDYGSSEGGEGDSGEEGGSEGGDDFGGFEGEDVEGEETNGEESSDEGEQKESDDNAQEDNNDEGGDEPPAE